MPPSGWCRFILPAPARPGAFCAIRAAFVTFAHLHFQAMNPLRNFDIAYVGLPRGVTELEFHVDDAFFQLFTNSLMQRARVRVLLELVKEPSFLLLNFHFSGSVAMNCCRCNAELDAPVRFRQTVVVKFDPHRPEEDDDSHADVVYIRRNDSHLSVAQLIYDYLTIYVTTQSMTCDQLPEPRACDPQVLAWLHQHTASNSEQRWEELKKIKIH